MKIEDLEDKVWQDIARARRSFCLIEFFVKELNNKSDKHTRNRFQPMIIAIWWAAMDSLTIALGRLLRPGDEDEVTLTRYRNAVVDYLNTHGAKRNESEYAQKSFKQLKNIKFLRNLRKQHNRYLKQILPWRNSIVAHSKDDKMIALPKDLPDILDFVEETHRICHSALEDAGIPGQYISPQFKKVADEWVELLIYTGKG